MLETWQLAFLAPAGLAVLIIAAGYAYGWYLRLTKNNE